jgi:hypothetical protein
MKVELNGETYRIEFEHGSGDGQHTAEYTTCRIQQVEVVHNMRDTEALVTVAEGTAVRYYKDPPNREMARKAALAKALQRLDREFEVESLNKARRKLFWDAYLGRKRAPPVELARMPQTAVEAAEFFAKYGNVGRAKELLAVLPTEAQLRSACDMARANGQPAEVVNAASALIMAPPAYSPKLVGKVTRNGRGWDVTFSCGHTVWWAVEPPREYEICAECLDEFATELRELQKRSGSLTAKPGLTAPIE